MVISWLFESRDSMVGGGISLAFQFYGLRGKWELLIENSRSSPVLYRKNQALGMNPLHYLVLVLDHLTSSCIVYDQVS